VKKKQGTKILLIGLLILFTFSIQQSDSIRDNWQFIKSNFFSSEKQSDKTANFFNFFNTNDKNVKKQRITLIPGGQSIGVTLQTRGVLVVGYSPIINNEGKEVFPAKDSGIEIGDIILKINGNQAINDLQVAQEIDKYCKKNQKISLEIKHKGEISSKTVQPVYCSETSRYRIGLYIRDEAAGVGTLTFIEPQTQKFGALGHVITDTDTNNQIELSDGKIMESTIYAIEKGKRGDPGEKIGTFMPESSFLGKIEENESSGIFGKYEGKVNNPFFNTPIPIAWKSEIQTGPAKMYTVIKDNTIQEFELKIEKIMLHRNDNKNMIIRITDPELLEKTGGIVQGMSGSPIIQNGKIVGAVTHVFVNDSTRGYAVFIEKMLDDSGILNKAASSAQGADFF